MNGDHTKENMLLQVESKVNHFLLLKDITDQCKNSYAINKTNGFLTIKSGNLHANKATRGWTLQVDCRDVSVEWVTLKYFKQY